MLAAFSKVALVGLAAGVVLLVPGAARPQNIAYSWSISASASDGWENHIEFSGPGVSTYYLWLLCAPESSDGVLAAEFGVASSSESNPILAFTPRNGFANAGTATNLLLTTGSCPRGPVLVGEILVLVTAPGSLCLTESAQEVFETQDCGSPPIALEAWRGLEFDGEFCFDGIACNIYDAPLPCCFPDGTCDEIWAPEWEEVCLGGGGYGPPVQFCADWDCEPVVGVATEPRPPEAWGRIKARYFAR